MGIQFRKSKKIGNNTRFNMSKSSVGISTGVKGARLSVNSKGRAAINLSIPGTGLRYRKVFGGKNSSAGVIAIIIMGFMNIIAYIMQICIVMTCWLFKLIIWIFYYLFLYLWKGCKYLYLKIIVYIRNKKSSEA